MFLLNLFATITGYIVWVSLLFVMVLLMIDTVFLLPRRRKRKAKRDFEAATGLKVKSVEDGTDGIGLFINVDTSGYCKGMQEVQDSLPVQEDKGLTLFDDSYYEDKR